jgi:hypothetical protein
VGVSRRRAGAIPARVMPRARLRRAHGCAAAVRRGRLQLLRAGFVPSVARLRRLPPSVRVRVSACHAASGIARWLKAGSSFASWWMRREAGRGSLSSTPYGVKAAVKKNSFRFSVYL